MTDYVAAALAEHVLTLARGLDIVVTSSTRHGRAWRREQRIAVPDVRSTVTYALALHEIGHVVGQRGSYRLETEANAWTWALAAALPGSVDARFQRKVRVSLGSYVAWAERTQHRQRPSRIPPADHPFWMLLANGGLPPTPVSSSRDEDGD